MKFPMLSESAVPPKDTIKLPKSVSFGGREGVMTGEGPVLVDGIVAVETSTSEGEKLQAHRKTVKAHIKSRYNTLFRFIKFFQLLLEVMPNGLLGATSLLVRWKYPSGCSRHSLHCLLMCLHEFLDIQRRNWVRFQC